MDLIAGLITPSDGSINSNYLDSNSNLVFSDNKAIQSSHIGYVTQSPVIFEDTLLNNITFWDSEPNLNMVDYVIKIAGLSGFVHDLELGLNTYVGDRGDFLSGGQKQRLCLARELYKETEVLILDEVTNALDSNTAGFISKTLESLSDQTTIILITHSENSFTGYNKHFHVEAGSLVLK